MKIKLMKCNENFVIPEYKHTNDAGCDIELCEDLIIHPGENKIPLGFKVIIPPGHAAFLTPRSSLMGIGILSCYVPIDADYSGEVHYIVYNATNKEFNLKKGERICQLLIQSGIVQADFVTEEEYDSKKRGSNGIGSTGK